MEAGMPETTVCTGLLVGVRDVLELAVCGLCRNVDAIIVPAAIFFPAACPEAGWQPNIAAHMVLRYV